MPDPSHEKQSTEGTERAALAALTRGIKLDQVQDLEGAVRAYRQAVELGHLSHTGPGREAGAQAAFNLGSVLGKAEGHRGSSPGLPGQRGDGTLERENRWPGSRGSGGL